MDSKTLINQYVGIVQKIARVEQRRIPNHMIEYEELVSIGIIAVQHNVPVIDNAPVARALFRMVDINQQIPPELYKAVAEILMFVYKMKKNTPNT